MKTRPYRSDDATVLAALYVQSVQQLGRAHYTPGQIAAWSDLAPSPERLEAQSRDGRLRLVAVDDTDRAVGFTDLEADGHIVYLYCAPVAAGRGVAAALYRELERRAQERGIRSLYAEASEVARSFFLRQGFTLVGRREFLLDGIAIHNYAVEKTLTTPRDARRLSS